MNWKKINNWIDEQVEMSDYLSIKENWTPMLKMVSRDFLVTGFVLGCASGCWLMFIFMCGLR